MRDGLNAVPTTAAEKIDCGRFLTPQEQHQVIIGQFNTETYISNLPTEPGLEVIYKKKSSSTQLSQKSIMLTHVKMPTMVGILTFISIIKTTYESLKP